MRSSKFIYIMFWFGFGNFCLEGFITMVRVSAGSSIPNTSLISLLL